MPVLATLDSVLYCTNYEQDSKPRCGERFGLVGSYAVSAAFRTRMTWLR